MHKQVEKLGFAGDLHHVARYFKSLKIAFLNLAEAPEVMGIPVNNEKTKHTLFQYLES